MIPKAIQTQYRGNNFRSRLEARWAVFFYIAKIKYTYEPEGFKTTFGHYLRDFYLSEMKLYIDVKGGASVPREGRPGAVSCCHRIPRLLSR